MRRVRLVASGAAVVVAILSCASDSQAPRAEPSLALSLEWSALSALPGDTVSLRVLARTDPGAALAGIGGRVQFDRSRIEFIGQPLTGSTIVIVNDSAAEQGRLRLVSFGLTDLPPSTAELAFRVLKPGYAEAVRYTFEEASTRDMLRIVRPKINVEPALFSSPPTAALPRRLTAADWIEYLGLTPNRQLQPNTPGAGLIYGDATLDGVINVLDAVSTANVSVGLAPLLTPTNRDFVIAGNVFPFNLPGLGELGDPLPPGQEADGSLVVTVSDVVATANEAVGINPPVVGELIPGRTIPSARVVLSGVVNSDRTLFSDTVYELHGNVDVPGGVTLTIQAGTRIEGDAASRGALVLRRGGNLDARGSRILPIVFTCNAPVKTRGCWGGIVINGLSLLNNGIVAQPGDPVTGCPERPSIGNPGIYGGCLIQDTSGVLRYARIEYAGMAPAGAGPSPGLALLGVGTGTVLDSVQVYGSLGDGVLVSGGTAQFRYLLLSNNAGGGLRWADGWVGKGQFLIVQQDQDNGPAIVGSNLASNPAALPRSNPQLYHVTVAGTAPGPLAGGGILLRDGTAAIIRDAVILQPNGVGLEIQGAESCTLAAAAAPSILVEHSIFFGGAPDFSDDADCIDEAAYATASARGNRVMDPILVDPLVTLSADLRPDTGSPAVVSFVAPPGDGFFETTPLYLGAVAPVNNNSSNVPWYPGWTRGWNGAP